MLSAFSVIEAINQAKLSSTQFVWWIVISSFQVPWCGVDGIFKSVFLSCIFPSRSMSPAIVYQIALVKEYTIDFTACLCSYQYVVNVLFCLLCYFLHKCYKVLIHKKLPCKWCAWFFMLFKNSYFFIFLSFFLMLTTLRLKENALRSSWFK